MANPFDVEAGDGNPFGRQKPAATPRPAPPSPPAAVPVTPIPPSNGATESRSQTAGLEQIRQRAVALQNALNHPVTDSLNQTETMGSDSTESVTVLVAADGLPKSLRVTSGWERNIRPEQFGSAVTEAALAARTKQMAEIRSPVGPTSFSASSDVPSPFTSGPPGSVTSPFSSHRAANAPRSPRALVNEMLKAADAAARYQPPAPPRGVGQSANASLTVTLSADGRVSCTADPQWAARSSSEVLSNAFGEALHSARLTLAQARNAIVGQQENPASAITSLIDDAIAMLQDPKRLTEL